MCVMCDVCMMYILLVYVCVRCGMCVRCAWWWVAGEAEHVSQEEGLPGGHAHC